MSNLEVRRYGWIFPEVCDLGVVCEDQPLQNEVLHQRVEDQEPEPEHRRENGAENKTWKNNEISGKSNKNNKNEYSFTS